VAAAGALAIGLVLPLSHTAATAQASPASKSIDAINALIEAAEPGETVYVPAGLYVGNLVIEKTVTLVADGEVVVDGNRLGDVIVIGATDVILEGFIVQGSGRDVSGEPTGIRVTADRASLVNNTVRDSLYGIALQYSNDHVVRGNHVSSILEFPTERRGHAYYLYYTRDNVIEDNVAITAKDGIFVGFGDGNRIDRNFVSDVRYGIHYMYANDNTFTGNTFRNSIAGAALMYSEGLTLHDNEFSYNTSRASGYGILIKDVDDVVMTGNRIHHNRLGMTLEGLPSRPDGTALIEGNLIGFNQTAIELFSTTRATFTGNSFIGNLRQVESRGGDAGSGNTWSLDGRGNYWDSYQGYDASGDGVGDRPYEHRGAYESLMDKNPALRAYSFTMAHQSFELAARWFVPYRMEPIVVDPSPLMKPTLTLNVADAGNERWLLAGASALVAGAIAVAMWLGRRTLERRWQPC
jgi:nitrous oxidase accessory protein